MGICPSCRNEMDFVDYSCRAFEEGKYANGDYTDVEYIDDDLADISFKCPECDFQFSGESDAQAAIDADYSTNSREPRPEYDNDWYNPREDDSFDDFLADLRGEKIKNQDRL